VTQGFTCPRGAGDPERGLSPLLTQLPLKAGRDEFIILNSALSQYTHTQFQEVYGPIAPVVWLNPKDAETLNIKDGGEVEFYNELGYVVVEAVVTDRVPRGVLWSPRQLTGLRGRAQNLLVPPTTQRIGGGPVFNLTRVRLRPRGDGPAPVG